MRVVALAIALVLASAVSASAAPQGKYKHKTKHWQAPRADRDCTPINGFYGYYGNPWCDTGSYRPADIEFRERQQFLRRQGWSPNR
jgi:hypothetical protein